MSGGGFLLVPLVLQFFFQKSRINRKHHFWVQIGNKMSHWPGTMGQCCFFSKKPYVSDVPIGHFRTTKLTKKSLHWILSYSDITNWPKQESFRQNSNVLLVLLSVSFILQQLSKIIGMDPELCGCVFPRPKLVVNLAYFLKSIPYN